MQFTTKEKFKNNQKFQSKLSWKRKEAMQIKESIKTFVSDNFDIDLPAQAPRFKHMAAESYHAEEFTSLREEYSELTALFYQFNYCGQSFASFFEDGKGKHETFTLAHTYSKHRFDPVWNMRKSNLIRKIYRKYLQDTQLYKKYLPVHITLTLPHAGGSYQGKEFYAAELITAFNLIRKQSFFKKATFGGEYGVEIKESPNKANGLHIHIHSLCFLKCKSVNQFRADMLKAWEKQTGANQIWVETLYHYKRKENGKFEVEIKNGKAYKKKFYVDASARAIEKREDLNREEKDAEILGNYLQAILETIKYHFKFEAVKDGKNYNVFLMNEILKNTKKKRLYSRFGNFYKVEALNFNKIKTKDSDAEPMAEAQQTAINPFLMEEIPVEKTQIVMFYPERQIRQSKSSPFAYDLINYKQKDFYTFLDPDQGIKKILSNHFNAMFNRGAIQIKEDSVKAKANKGNKNFLNEILFEGFPSGLPEPAPPEPYFSAEFLDYVNFNEISIN